MKIVFEQPVVNVVELATGPKGDAGPASTIPGPANTLAIGTVTEGASPDASITGTPPNQTLNLTLKNGADGPPNTLAIGTVVEGPTAGATITGTSPNQTLNLVLPEADPGPPNTLTIGTVGSGASPAASITGTSPNQTLNLTLVPGIGVPTTGNNPGDLLRWNGSVWIQTATKFHEGTGNPNGVVTAPVGSTFVNTESGGYNGARRWTKATGTGNTGWVVVDGDTGLMTLKNNLVNGWTHSITEPTGITLRRINNTVTLTVNSSLLGGSATSAIFLDPLPAGFRIHRTFEAQTIYLPLIRSGTTTPSAAAYIYTAGRAYLQAATGQNHHGIAVWNTQEAWPATNPYPSI